MTVAQRRYVLMSRRSGFISDRKLIYFYLVALSAAISRWKKDKPTSLALNTITISLLAWELRIGSPFVNGGRYRGTNMFHYRYHIG